MVQENIVVHYYKVWTHDALKAELHGFLQILPHCPWLTLKEPRCAWSVQTLVTFRPLNKELPEPALVSHYWYHSCMSHCCEGPVGPCNGTSSAMLGNGSNSLLRKEPGIQPPRPAAAVPHNSWLANGQLWWVQKNEKNRSFSFWSRLEKLGERWRKVKWVAFPSKEVNYHSKKNWIKGNWCQTEKKKKSTDH